MAETTCPYGDDSLIVVDYVAGRLSDANTQAFEAHTFDCDRCFEELECATGLRAASGDGGDDQSSAAPPAAPSSRRATWPALAMAAAMVLAFGLWFAQPLVDGTGPGGLVYRDAGNETAPAETLQLDVEWEGDDVLLRWDRVGGADLYEVRVFSEAGEPVFEQRTRATTAALAAGQWRESAPSGRFYAQVVALDELRQLVVQSDFEPL